MNMNKSNVNILDLPNEILFIILKKLDNMDVLYSLLDVNNQQLDIIVQENIFTSTLNFVLTTLTDDIYSFADPILERFCISILPRIHQNVKSLIIDSVSMKRILLAGDYPNLTELKIFNFNGKIVSCYFTVESPFRRIFQQQITDLILVFENDFNEIVVKHYTTDVYGYILKFFKTLKHLSIIGSFPPLALHNFPLTTFFSATLHKLCVDVMNYEDCLALLDGRLKQLTTLIIVINNMEYDASNVYNMDNLPNLKCFNLRCICLAESYDGRILPLIRRMSNVEELNLDISIENRTAFIDGTHIYNEILIHMSRLHTFNFYICTDIRMDNSFHHLSKDDIQQTFNNIIYKQVDCIMKYRYSTARCDVFSLPFMFNYLKNIGNTFPTIIFNNVRSLMVQDGIPFKHEFFIRIAWSFPLLKELWVINYSKPPSPISDKLNSNDNQLDSTIIEYTYLTSLHLNFVHHDYIDQFLNDKKIHLPNLTKLTVNYDKLIIVTENFTRDETRLNCMKVKKLIIDETIVHSKDFYIYFPLL